MSADNWTTCPACHAKERERIAGLHEAARAAYGKVPPEEFDRLRAEAEYAAATELPANFREDYEFYGADEGTVHIVYSGHCKDCGLGIDIEEERPFWSPEARS